MNHMLLENPDLAQSFIRKLLYFDIFSHPLLAEEIFEYCDFPDVEKTMGRSILEELTSSGLINCQSGFYFVGEEDSKVTRRLEANQLAGERMNEAKKYSSIVASFPFVRAVFISGSLSKHVMKPDSDVDFFIITEPGKLWVCRALLTVYKKLVLRNSHRNFCLNYFIDSNNLEIPDKNIFTATEVVFLLPMYNYPLYESFMAVNNWARAEYPNFKVHSQNGLIPARSAKNAWEYVFNNSMGSALDQLSFWVIRGFWKRKFRHLDEKSFNLNFRSWKNVSKHHPNAFQERVVSKYSEKITAFEQSTGFQLNHISQKKIVS